MFSILVIVELHGAKSFNKLDLHSNYHQIIMKVEDKIKIMFHTHEGLYEILGIQIGLCNAPSTFQIIMSKIFKPYLCDFMLVLFDDILVYSKTWDAHVQHVGWDLQLL